MNINFRTVYNIKYSKKVNIFQYHTCRRNSTVFTNNHFKFRMWDITKISNWQSILLCSESWGGSLRLDTMDSKSSSRLHRTQQNLTHLFNKHYVPGTILGAVQITVNWPDSCIHRVHIPTIDKRNKQLKVRLPQTLIKAMKFDSNDLERCCPKKLSGWWKSSTSALTSSPLATCNYWALEMCLVWQDN